MKNDWFSLLTKQEQVDILQTLLNAKKVFLVKELCEHYNIKYNLKIQVYEEIDDKES